MQTSLIPTLSPLHQQTWPQIPGLGPFSEFSRSDYCFLKFLELTWFLLQSLTIRPSAMQEAGNQLCSCEIFDLKQDSRLPKCELCNVCIVQQTGPHCEQRSGEDFWSNSTSALCPLWASHPQAPSIVPGPKQDVLFYRLLCSSSG